MGAAADAAEEEEEEERFWLMQGRGTCTLAGLLRGCVWYVLTRGRALSYAPHRYAVESIQNLLDESLARGLEGDWRLWRWI
jgi:hypothetical protein